MRPIIAMICYWILGMVLLPSSTMKAGEALARITFYSADTCPFGFRSATGVRLEEGRHCAVDPKVVPYGAIVHIPNLGERRAVDTGTAVITRQAARASGKTRGERAAIVIDVFCRNRKTMERLAEEIPPFLKVTWEEEEEWTPKEKIVPVPDKMILQKPGSAVRQAICQTKREANPSLFQTTIDGSDS